MSTRTIIEINHDLLHELEKYPLHFAALVAALRSCDLSHLEHIRVPGVRVLGQRHHSETLTIKVQ